MMKLCVNCKYCEVRETWLGVEHLCKHQINLVTGETSEMSCGLARRESVYCGPSGNWFEKRD